MARHAFKFFSVLLVLIALTVALHEFFPGQVPQLLPATADFLPFRLKTAKNELSPAPTAQTAPKPIFTNRDKGLANFYRKLSQLKNGRRERVRVMHFGDSVIWYERVARDIRAGLARDFGDGGRGQVYLHQDWGVSLAAYENLTKDGFDFLTIPYNHFNHFEPKWLPETGFTGWTYRAQSPAAAGIHRIPATAAAFTQLNLIIRPADRLTQKVRITNLEKNPPETQEHNLALKKDGCSMHELTLPATRHVALGFGDPSQAREKSAYLDAVLLETARGVSYSTFVHKGRHMAWMNSVTPGIFECGYRAAHPDLLVFQYGINEGASIDWKAFGFSHDIYRKQMREFFGRLRHALPDVDILIIGPYERLKKNGDSWVTYQAHDDVRVMQREIAEEMGFAFFDSYAFLGGAGHMLRMIREGTAAGDYAHLNDKGSEMLGNEIYRQIYAGYSGKRNGNGAPAATVSSTATNEPTPSPILFNSMAFVYFFIVVFAVAAFLNRIPCARLIFLTLASWYFYASWRWWALGLMLFSTGIDYYAAVMIDRAHEKSAKGWRSAKFWLLFSLISNLGLLFFFKYYDFFAELINPFLGKGDFFQIPVLKLILPVGISFYTFQSLSYTIDVYRKHMPAEKSFWRFALFVSFFPQLVAGPIVRATDFLPQMMQSIRHFFINKADFSSAIYLFSKGLFKKTLADWLSVNLADRVFSDPGMFTSAETLVGVYAFGIQIYLDFSSYTDMAIGAARLMGFNLTINFNRPYVARTITEFWRRWHISLSTWLRDYLYISLGGNRKRIYLNLFLTMLLGGLWHGAGINFALWGILHGAVLMLERRTGYAAGADGFKLWKPVSIFITFHVVMFSWILFRCHDMAAFTGVMDSLKSLTLAAPNLDWKIFAAVTLPYFWQFVPEKFHFLSEFLFTNSPPALQGIAAYLVAIATYRIYTSEVKTFIYFQF